MMIKDEGGASMMPTRRVALRFNVHNYYNNINMLIEDQSLALQPLIWPGPKKSAFRFGGDIVI
ncbi:MAG: hypothetical protein LBP33_03165 [Candidatus Adiutrix sp.]|jgi:hypothetical protein|nr:hypothetical protein [Candidatus Adiutrix sp.]